MVNCLYTLPHRASRSFALPWAVQTEVSTYNDAPFFVPILLNNFATCIDDDCSQGWSRYACCAASGAHKTTVTISLTHRVYSHTQCSDRIAVVAVSREVVAIRRFLILPFPKSPFPGSPFPISLSQLLLWLVCDSAVVPMSTRTVTRDTK